MGFNLLENVNVLDLGREISGPLCAKLLADLGAQVIKVEPPTGDPARSTGPFPGDLPDPEQSGLFLALNANKLGVTINLETATGRDLLLQLVDQTDLIIENFPPSYLGDLGIGYNVLSARNPNLVLTSVTPFGNSGPWADYLANNLTVCNLSGHSREHPGPVEDLQAQPPLQLAARQAEFVAGLAGATASVTALNRRRSQGKGCHVDVSGMEALALLLQTTLAEFSLGNAVRRREDVARQSLLALLPCIDGYVAISPRQQDQWERTIGFMDNPEWASDVRFATRESRLANWDDLEPLLASWTSLYHKEEVYRLAQAHRVPAFPLNTAGDLFEATQFRARGFFTQVEHPVAGKHWYPGFPIRLASGREFELTPAPLLGEHNSSVFRDKVEGKDFRTLRETDAV